VGVGIVGADERATFVGPRRDVTADDNARCIAAKVFAGIDVRLDEPSSVANAKCWCSRPLPTAACSATSLLRLPNGLKSRHN
jgi:hypothetical protein